MSYCPALRVFKWRSTRELGNIWLDSNQGVCKWEKVKLGLFHNSTRCNTMANAWEILLLKSNTSMLVVGSKVTWYDCHKNPYSTWYQPFNIDWGRFDTHVLHSTQHSSGLDLCVSWSHAQDDVTPIRLIAMGQRLGPIFLISFNFFYFLLFFF